MSSRRLCATGNAVILFLFIVFFDSALIAQSSTAGSKTASPQSGSVKDGIYKNEFLGLEYPLFEGAEVRPVDMGTMPNGIFILLIADQHTGRPQMNRIVLTADESSRYTWSLDRYFSKLLNAQLARAQTQLVRDSHKTTIAQREFYRAEYQESFPGGALHNALACTAANGYFLCWTMVSTVPEELERLVGTLDRVSIQDAHAASKQSSAPCVPDSKLSQAKRPLRVRVSAGVSQGLILKKVQPEYPEEARAKHIEGAIVLKALISQEGTIKELSVVSGSQVLVAETLRAVIQWVYKPYQLNCEPVEVETQIVVNYVMPGSH